MKMLPFRQIKSPGENTTGRNRSTSSHRKPASVFWNISTRFKVSKWTFIAISACRKLPPEIQMKMVANKKKKIEKKRKDRKRESSTKKTNIQQEKKWYEMDGEKRKNNNNNIRKYEYFE